MHAENWRGKNMGKMKKGKCRCTVKGMQYCKTDEGVKFTGRCFLKEEE